ncbi:MAG: hypothetical protein R2824_10660 [Saprospiraceae bacterium]
MRTNYFSCILIVSTLFISTSAFTQTVNFDETWKEFLDNDKISNMSELVTPNKIFEQPKYAKYLLMNTNSDFCQSDVEGAETLMTELQAMDPQLHKSIPGFVEKLDDLDAKIKAYYSMDAIWQRFLQTKEVSLEELDAIKAAKTSCEKRTLAKYSYMTAYYHFCTGNVPRSKDIFENRTLRLTEKTTLRVRDVEGLEKEVATMKSMYQDMDKLDVAWKKYVSTGVSPGFDMELPLFPCNPIPKMKELLLKGVLDLCEAGPAALDRIKELQAASSVPPDRELDKKIKDLEAAIGKNESSLAILNEAWEAFIPDNKVKHFGKYGHKFCSKEPLIRAYIMDGFAYTCELGEEMLRKIDSLQRPEITPLEQITMIKINELAALSAQYQTDGINIESIWNKFVAQGDRLTQNYQSAEFYCDNIHQVKDWTIRGLSGSCEEGTQYLGKIEEFQRTFEFSFTKDLECRVQKLRIKVWDCRYEALQKLARVEVESDAYEKRLQELMTEYGMGERPEVCSFDE